MSSSQSNSASQAKIRAQVVYNQNIPYGGWDIYIPDTRPGNAGYSRMVQSCPTKSVALTYCADQGYAPDVVGG